MTKFKYITVLFFIFSFFYTEKAFALDIQYATILGTKGSDMLVQYYGIDKKNNYICSTITAKCSPTKKTTLGIYQSTPIDQTLKLELETKDVGHITMSYSKNLLAYYKGGNDANPSRTYTVRDIKTGKEYTISNSVSYWDLVDDEGRVFDFSPDEKKLVYLDDRDGSLSLYSIDMSSLSDTTLSSTKLPLSAYQIDDFLFTDQDTIYYIGNTKASPYVWSLYRYNFKTGKDVVLETNVSYVDPLKKIGNVIVFNRLQAKGYGIEMYNTSTKKLVQFKVPGISTKKNLTNQEVIYTGNATGILMKPPTTKNKSKTYPLVIWLHGGPYRQTSYGYQPYHSYGIYDSILELMRKDNVVVLKLDYRGSYGFGRAYAEGIKGGVGKGDVVDVMDAITYAKSRYNVSKVYLMGNSYGGYLALRTLVEHPNSLAGVVSINGVTDWESLLDKMKVSIFNTQFNGAPNESNRTLYDTASIINKIENIGGQKISIIAGIADRTIPYSQATMLYDKLKASNKNVTLVSYAGEDHVFKSKKNISDLCKQLFTFVGVSVDKECVK